MVGSRLARSRLRPERGDAHQAHQPLHPLAVRNTPSARNVAVIRREPRNGQAVNRLIDAAHRRASRLVAASAS